MISSFTYDAAGNIATTTGEGAAAYTHDARNRLTEANITGGSNIYYTYDAQGRLIRRATSTTDIQYRYNDKTGALMHELDANGNITTSYVSDSSGRIISVTRAQNTQTPTTFFYHHNAHGDVIAISDSSGSIIASFTYDAWGVPTEKDANGNPVALIGTWTQTTGGTPGNGLFFLFGGMLYDAAAGLYLTRTRAYNPRTGRFLERDILDESGKKGVYAGFPFGKDAIGTNLYAWCGNNPVNMVDPSGMTEVWANYLWNGILDFPTWVDVPDAAPGDVYNYDYETGDWWEDGSDYCTNYQQSSPPWQKPEPVTVITYVASQQAVAWDQQHENAALYSGAYGPRYFPYENNSQGSVLSSPCTSFAINAIGLTGSQMMMTGAGPIAGVGAFLNYGSISASMIMDLSDENMPGWEKTGRTVFNIASTVPGRHNYVTQGLPMAVDGYACLANQ